MALNEGDIREMLAGFFPANRPTVLGTIADVDEASRTCTLDDDGVPMTGVRLQAVTGGDKGVLIVPKNGALALAVRVEESEDWMLIDCSEIDKISIVIGGSTVELTNGLTQFNGGKLGGLVKIKELEENLNSLKDFVEAINTALPSAFSAVGAATAANGAAGASAYNTSMDGKSVVIKDMENKKITH